MIMDTLTANGGECTFEALFAKSEELHCDVLTAALGSLKRKKVVGYDSEMPLLHPKDNAGGVLTFTALTDARLLVLSKARLDALPATAMLAVARVVMARSSHEYRHHTAVVANLMQ